jgi:hypothetical protein
MKILKIIILLAILSVYSQAKSQVSINMTVGSPPAWGPVGYDQVQYYYLPDVESYYDIRASQFIYFGNGRWIRSRYLPRAYRNYDLYNGYKVVMNDYHGSRPYENFNNIKIKYNKGYMGEAQGNIGNRPENNNQNRNKNEEKHEEKNHGKGNQGHGKGRH